MTCRAACTRDENRGIGIGRGCNTSAPSCAPKGHPPVDGFIRLAIRPNARLPRHTSHPGVACARREARQDTRAGHATIHDGSLRMLGKSAIRIDQVAQLPLQSPQVQGDQPALSSRVGESMRRSSSRVCIHDRRVVDCSARISMFAPILLALVQTRTIPGMGNNFCRRRRVPACTPGEQMSLHQAKTSPPARHPVAPAREVSFRKPLRRVTRILPRSNSRP